MQGFVQKENEKTKGVDYIQVHQTIKLTIDCRVAYTHECGPDKAVHTIRFNWSVATLIVQFDMLFRTSQLVWRLALTRVEKSRTHFWYLWSALVPNVKEFW